MPRKFIQKYSILNAKCRGRGGTESAESYHTMKQNHQKASQAMLHKGNMGHLKSITDQAHCGLETDISRPLWWEELDSQDLNQQLSQSPGSRPFLAFQAYYLF